MTRTISSDTLSESRALLEVLFEESASMVAFTGAGISTECGVPDFRSPNSPWTRNKPIDFADFLADPAMQVEAWRRKFTMDDLYAHARPGRGHKALASLAKAGAMDAVITQNIDGLHQASGLDDSHVIELHGNGTYARCLECGLRHELAGIRAALEQSGLPPRCSCGGVVKSATISFGQAMPENEMRRARAATLSCDLMLAIGSSLVVYPAAGFPLLAQRNGARLVIINNAQTPLDDDADVVLRGDIGDILAPFV